MDEKRLGGNIALVGFDILEPAELIIVKKIVGTYVKKLQENTEYKELKLVLKQSQHGKTFKHEINAQLDLNKGSFQSKVTEWNLFKAISTAMEKLISEFSHQNKKDIKKKTQTEKLESETEETE